MNASSPSSSQPAVRTQALLRAAEGAGEDDVLFAGRDGQPVAARQLVYALTAPMTELGVAVAAGNVPREAVSSKGWANRWGVSVQAL